MYSGKRGEVCAQLLRAARCTATTHESADPGRVLALRRVGHPDHHLDGASAVNSSVVFTDAGRMVVLPDGAASEYTYLQIRTLYFVID
jgi:hypothetical protein